MKKQFFTLSTIFGFLLIVGAAIIIFNIDQTTNNLDGLVKRYQKEKKCSKILISIKKIQQDSFLHHHYDSADLTAMNKRIAHLDATLNTCKFCHHPQGIRQRINTLTYKKDDFKQALTTIFVDPDSPNHKEVDLKAFSMGEDLYTYAQSLFKRSSNQLAAETRIVRSLTIKSKNFIYLIVISGLFIMIFSSLFLVRCFTKPLQILLRATEKIENGDFNSRVSGLKHEFGTLADSFNDMAASLQVQMKQLQRSEQLATCGTIATTLVHEVRNPLAGIKVAMDVLADESGLSESDKKILRQVVKEVNLIDSLLSNMLEFARPKPPQLSHVNINDVIQRCLRFTPGVITKEISIDWDKSVRPPDTRIDPNQINQVLLNLFINAESAMPDGGTIFITVSWTETDIHLCVADNGPGIDQNAIDDIFTPFFTTKAKGSGLGLATCKTLINLHGGRISAANRPEGGAIFTIILPIVKER